MDGTELVALLCRTLETIPAARHRRHSEHRLGALSIMANDPSAMNGRRFIESCFGTQGNVIGGLGPLPNHVRRLRRVRLWVAAKARH